MPNNNDIVKWGNLQDLSAEIKSYVEKKKAEIESDTSSQIEKTEQEISAVEAKLNEMFSIVD